MYSVYIVFISTHYELKNYTLYDYKRIKWDKIKYEKNKNYGQNYVR